jgi:hypothetical protein
VPPATKIQLAHPSKLPHPKIRLAGCSDRLRSIR